MSITALEEGGEVQAFSKGNPEQQTTAVWIKVEKYLLNSRFVMADAQSLAEQLISAFPKWLRPNPC